MQLNGRHSNPYDQLKNDAFGHNNPLQITLVMNKRYLRNKT